ncbi:GmrSD restriction endonuclease domain-containing protein [Prochlorococcus marinus]|uniref:GmrSD restriction endonuclease domain-containing protein n=1 Tax=Prochlorococcus marinus TaxID=1219 RepID=UPI0022B47F65|nr:DUF262 domain-containing protein [Prochlorococcus marinus]
MSSQRYSVTPHPIDTLLTWVKSGEIAIPEIQRPFVWDSTKVRNLMDSLYRGFPVGYLIAWRNPTVKLKDGSTSAGKRILIDGQQRVTALMAALLGQKVINKNYSSIRIKIAFNPLAVDDEKIFEVSNPAILKSSEWVPDISSLFDSDNDLLDVIEEYMERNPTADRKTVGKSIQKLLKILNNQVGLIELAEDLDIETVTEIFIRVNSAGAELSQADFAMSKIAVNESYGGNTLRKAIEYFCNLAVAPECYSQISENDKVFASTPFFQKMSWLKDVNDDIYDPTYTDMLRVAFTSEFGRGKLQDLVALLSGRNFETRQYEEEIAAESFQKLEQGVYNFINKTHFDRLTMILRSAGFITSDLIRSRNAVNFAYIFYLVGRRQKVPADDLEKLVRRWFAMSILKGRYSGSPESRFDQDIRQINEQGLTAFAETILETEFPDTYWTAMLPQSMDTSSSNSPYFIAYQAAQVKAGDQGFLSSHITVSSLMQNQGDKHHFFPRKHLQRLGYQRGKYNQIANFVITQTEINIAISDKAPEVYISEVLNQCKGGPKRYGGITDQSELERNLEMNCIPLSILNTPDLNYESFLDERRKLIALKIKKWIGSL